MNKRAYAQHKEFSVKRSARVRVKLAIVAWKSDFKYILLHAADRDFEMHQLI
jgi:hypothetical protein